ncbi:hypothetical protein HNR15_003538 [Allobranchiibius huperziae]|uniref:Uncharacterized protein n=1 Tax=Allobranchiibius huperziae TaxID=1874116 RepID=A0A853DPL8_9MICO|nr:hypothetical protein [Allobranchiibius huperziae]
MGWAIGFAWMGAALPSRGEEGGTLTALAVGALLAVDLRQEQQRQQLRCGS